MKIRNIAIIAHVDHGKTTLVDAMLKQSGIFRSNQEVEKRVMDSDQLEKERGITILSKNASVNYQGVKINIVDTPGHADFGGEVERVLKMVDGVLLLVDAFEGPMPQTRAVLKKALHLNLKPILVINKIDRPEANIERVIDKVIDLFIDLGSEDLEFPIVYASAKAGVAKQNLEDEVKDLKPLFESILKNIPSPKQDVEDKFRMLVSNIDYDEYVGRMAVGKIETGTARINMPVNIIDKENKIRKAKITKIYTFEGLKRVETDKAEAGDIILISGIPNINIGETICDETLQESIGKIEIEKPTISMNFSVNDGPFAGNEGEYITSRHLKDRLERELEKNVSLEVEEIATDTFKVSGRGELHLTILAENMRREGYEFLISRPKVILKEENGKKYEPIERLTISVPTDDMGIVIEKLGKRKAEMLNMENESDTYTKIEFKIPSRSLIGYPSEFMTDTKGNGIMSHVLEGYEEYKGDIKTRTRGSIVAFERGKSVTYGLYNAQDKGELFIGPGVEVYEGMIVGMNSRPEDLVINVCKEKHLTNMRASGADDALRLTPPIQMSLEKSIDYIDDDELIEVTPKSIRMRKKILNNKLRGKQR